MKQIIAVILVLASLSACTVYKQYPIDVFNPGKVNIPGNAENAAVVYRNFKYTNDTLLHYYKKDFRLYKARKDPKELDSLMASYCIGEMAKKLKENNVFNEIRIFPDVFKLHKGEKLPALDFNVVDKLSETANADILISLESFSYFFSKYPASDVSVATNDVITAAVWGVYDAVENRLIERKTMIDTICWNGLDKNGNKGKSAKLPPRLTSLKVAAQMAGENYAKRFSASWQTVNRMYAIAPISDFEIADKYVQEGDWDSAMMIWKRYVNDSNNKMAINARYNMALAYEMKDDLVTAEKWLRAANEIAVKINSKEYKTMISDYYKILAKRGRDIERLNE